VRDEEIEVEEKLELLVKDDVSKHALRKDVKQRTEAVPRGADSSGTVTY
jgi:hypothetical protein